MNRQYLQQLCQIRMMDAESLLSMSQWSGAYYLAGYAMECALKSCVLAYVERTGIIFLERKFLQFCWTHDLEQLATTAGLDAELGKTISANPQFGSNWLRVTGWSEEARYRILTQQNAEVLYNAINDQPDGVLSWVKRHW